MLDSLDIRGFIEELYNRMTPEEKQLVQLCLKDTECSNILMATTDYLYYKYLFTREIDKNYLVEKIKEALGR